MAMSPGDRRPLDHLVNDSIAVSVVSDIYSSTEQDAFDPPPMSIKRSKKDHHADAPFRKVSHMVVTEGSSWYFSAFIVVNAALGAGLLNFPSAFQRAGGIVVAMIAQFVLALLAFVSLLMLAWCADLRGANTYQQVVGLLCGRFASVVASALLALYCYVTDISFLIIVGDESDRLMDHFFGEDFCHKFYLDRRFIITLCAVVLMLPFCFSKKIDFLKTISTVATIGVFYLCALVIYNYTVTDLSPAAEIRTSPASWTDVFMVVGPITFTYQCHVSAIPVYSCLSDRRLPVFARSLVLAFGVCLIVNSILGIFGYLTYGSLIQPDLWSSIAIKNPAYTFGLIIFILKVCSTYPILVFCGRTAVETIYLELRGMESDPVQLIVWERRRRYVVSLLWFVTTLGISYFLHDLGKVVGFLGCLAAMFIFFFPGLTLLQATFILHEKFSDRQRWLLWFISGLWMAVGAYLAGLVLVDVFVQPPAAVEKNCYGW